jgi:hypothetical protein
VENCLAGYNSCIFAYGQTGSGKTYTMTGPAGVEGFLEDPVTTINMHPALLRQGLKSDHDTSTCLVMLVKILCLGRAVSGKH